MIVRNVAKAIEDLKGTVEYLGTIVEGLKQRIDKLECQHKNRVYEMSTSPFGGFSEKCSNCGKVLNKFESEQECLAAESNFRMETININNKRIIEIEDRKKIGGTE